MSSENVIFNDYTTSKSNICLFFSISVDRVTQHKCYIVATCDKDLKRRIRKIPGVPIMYLAQHRYSIERMPDAYGAPKT